MTHEQAKAARALANELFKGPCNRAAAQSDRCLERHRYTNGRYQELRPFSQIDPERLCSSCRTYWYAEMAAQTLERTAKLTPKEEG